MRDAGLTLLELLLVLAILGILLALAGLNFGGSARALAVTGFAHELALAIQQSATRANTNNQVYAVRYASTGVTWGPVASSMTLSGCETASTAPALASATGTVAAPTGITTPAGWLCISAPGLVTRLDQLTPCNENGVSIPCLAVRRGTTARRVLVSGNGQTEVR
ncbi:prepilin-type N-terminal cleavage/methylation domain-containing protein [Deinococcus sp. HSC-46F16]|uniref:prepilin-type N-terminal cleavage/methylation domain-containing protein n=1 Tax=Deinococcus sp. HSC-46F16 TaxID=2910968 RepID=UPI00209F8100|nr:prepilin-type N-terminal cleavage/methylation domain-containing protein [Deinococcus sp. HSC-46F16]MCP2014241.1 prepilin-type N-terminal cleavage/methylation domain-containing protein [Deinococcus sp. HSC-46F16]